jgi:hypothetical protein
MLSVSKGLHCQGVRHSARGALHSDGAGFRGS